MAMTKFTVSEGTPTAYGGRTVMVKVIPEKPTCARNYRIWKLFMAGINPSMLAAETGLSESVISRILSKRRA